MTNSEDSAFPVIQLPRDSEGEIDPLDSPYLHGGLTKREFFAAIALQGILSNDSRTAADYAMGQGAASSNESENKALARGAVCLANALIDELNKVA